ncbi:MAG: HDOD domain-containing protein [Desulfobacteraceae bacterium]
MRTLIVDDDAEIRKALKAMLIGIGKCEEALDRDSALTLFDKSYADGTPYDLVTVEIGMADMDGAAILRQFRSIESKYRNTSNDETCLMVITALSARQLEIDCLIQGGNDFICKPFETKHFLERLARLELTGKAKAPEPDIPAVISTREILDTISRKLNKGQLKLPPAPKVAMKVRQMVTCNASIDEVIDLLKQDLSISTKLISISNSAFYRGVEKSASLGQAVRRLGIDRSIEVVMSICCSSYFTTNHPAYKKLVEELWWHCLACAHATEMVDIDGKKEKDEDLFSLGLLHDIGKLVLIQVAGDLDPARHSKMAIPLSGLEEMMNTHHRRFGARVLKKWGYSEELIHLVRRCGTQDLSKAERAAQVLHRANLLAKAAGFGIGVEDAAEIAQALEQQGLTDQRQAELKAEIVDRIDQLRHLFG